MSVSRQKRNVFLIVIDQLRADCLRLAINGKLVMPNLNEFRRHATTFNRHYSVTGPCGPSRASLLTGLYAMNHRSVRNGAPLRADLTNIALEVRRSGYEPLLFGYTDTSVDPRRRHPNDPDIRCYEGVMPGFNEVVEMRLESGSFPWRAHLLSRGYELPELGKFSAPHEINPLAGPNPSDPAFYRAEDSDTAFLTDSCIGQLSVRSENQWFALLTYLRPHPPFIAPEPYNRMHDPKYAPPAERLATPEEEANFHPFSAVGMKQNSIAKTVEGYGDQLNNESEADIAGLRSVYYGLASEVDHHVGRVIQFLKDSGQFDNTLVIITSDHGELLGDRRQWGKVSFHDAVFHVPLVIRDPDRIGMHGEEVDEFTESTDVSPTILDWLSGGFPSAMNGCSLLPHLAGQRPEGWRNCCYCEVDFGEPDEPTVWQRELGLGLREANFLVLRERQFKLVHFNGGLPPLLFDMQSTEGESLDLAGDPARSGELLRMTRKLLDHRMRHADHALSDMKLTEAGTVNFRP